MSFQRLNPKYQTQTVVQLVQWCIFLHICCMWYHTCTLSQFLPQTVCVFLSFLAESQPSRLDSAWEKQRSHLQLPVRQGDRQQTTRIHWLRICTASQSGWRSSCHKRLCKVNCFPSADRIWSQRMPACCKELQSRCLNRTAERRAGGILPCTCQPEMMTDFLWAGDTLIVSSWTKRSLHRVWRKLYTYTGSGDDLNICEYLCSPGVVLCQQKTVEWWSWATTTAFWDALYFYLMFLLQMTKQETSKSDDNNNKKQG